MRCEMGVWMVRGAWDGGHACVGIVFEMRCRGKGDAGGNNTGWWGLASAVMHRGSHTMLSPRCFKNPPTIASFPLLQQRSVFQHLLIPCPLTIPICWKPSAPLRVWQIMIGAGWAAPLHSCTSLWMPATSLIGKKQG